MKLSLLIAAALIWGAAVAKAQTVSTTDTSTNESTSKLKIFQNKQIEDNTGITEQRIKAETGSRSRYSAKFSFGYQGPRIGDISNPEQPNPDNSVRNVDTKLIGDVALRYRLNSSSALNFGAGVTANTPFQEVKRFDVSNPFISYDKVFKIGGWQSLQSIGVSETTVPEFKHVGEYGGARYISSWFHRVNDTRFLAGVDYLFFLSAFYRSYNPRTDKRTTSNYATYILPTLKYQASDKLGLYSSIAMSYADYRVKRSIFAVKTLTPSQRIGLEYSFARDVYFAPFLNFYPQSFTWATTTINFYTVFSIL